MSYLVSNISFCYLNAALTAGIRAYFQSAPASSDVTLGGLSGEFNLAFGSKPTQPTHMARNGLRTRWSCGTFYKWSPISALKHKHHLRGTANTLTPAHNHITPAVAAMDSCFVLIRTHQHGTAPGERSQLQASTSPFTAVREQKHSFKRQLHHTQVVAVG